MSKNFKSERNFDRREDARGSARNDARSNTRRGNSSFKGSGGNQGNQYERSSRSGRPSRFDSDARGKSSPDSRRFKPDYRRGDAAKGASSRAAAPRKVFAPATDDLCWGRNPILTLLRHRPELCRRVRVLIGANDDFTESVVRLCADKNIALEFAERDVLDQLSGGAVHQGVVANINPIPPADLDEVVDALAPAAPALIVLLDHCQDPHNLGAVIRTAEVAGAACVVTQNDRSATVNGTVVKTSAGAAFRLPVAQVVNVNRALERLKSKGFWVVGLDHHTDETVWSNPLPERLVLVVGSEGDGIAPLVLKNCDKLVKFPMAGHTGNLNAGVAAALGMFEWVRLHGTAK